MPLVLEPILSHLPAWVLVLFRLTGVFLFAPMFGSVLVPRQFKVFLALGLSFCVYPLLLTPGTPAAASLGAVIDGGLSFWSLMPVVAAELAIGLVIGYGATLPLAGMQMGGQMIAQQLGLGLAEVINPGQEQSGVLSEMFYLVALVFFLLLNGHHVILRTLVESFNAVPLGAFRIDQSVMDLVLGMLASMFHLAIRVAAPLLCLVFLETVAMGFIARTVPQMNILSVGFAVRILLGVGLLVLAAPVLIDVMRDFLQSDLTKLAQFFGG